jgi:hypothetical protein
MTNIFPALHGVKLALLEAQLMSGEVEHRTFVDRATALGLPSTAASTTADKFLAIAANQAARRAVEGHFSVLRFCFQTRRWSNPRDVSSSRAART